MLTITKATPTISLVVGGPHTYDGTAKPVTSATVAGVDSTPLGDATVTYSGNAITIVVANKTKVYGEDNPPLTGTFTGAVAADGITVSYATTAVKLSDVGGYPITATLADPNSKLANYTVSNTAGTLTITPQTANPLADAFYTGSIFFWTPGATNSNATLTLAATIKNSPNYGGDIRTAKVSFFIRNSDGSRTPINGAQNLPVGLVNSDDLTVGSAAATVSYNIGSANVASLQIGIIVTGNYTVNPQSAEYDKIITIAKPVPGGQIVGGVDLDGGSAAGYVKGSSNLTFNVQYNKSMRNPQGTVEAIVRSSLNRNGVTDGLPHTYRLKSNAISTLAVNQPTQNDAQFTSKANISEIINGVDQAIEGNCTMQFDMKAGTTDGPAGDQVAITVYRAKGGIWYSNNWDGTKTSLKQILAGNVSVSGASTGAARIAAVESQEPTMQLEVEASPNPTTGLLKVSVTGAGKQSSVKLRVYNLMQRVEGEWSLELTDGQGQKTIDISKTQGGVYLLSVEGDNQRAVKRILRAE